MTHVDRPTIARRSLFAATAATALTLASARGADAQGAAAVSPTRNAATNRVRIGEFTVTTISDGFLAAPRALFTHASAETIDDLARRAFLPDGALHLGVNAFLVERGDNRVLIDAGTAGAFGPTLGHVGENLRAAGIDPASVHTVLATHMHPDHIFGIATPDGQAAFPNAELVLPQSDHAFWFDDGAMSRAPADGQAFFTGARAAAKPYASRLRLIGPGEVMAGIEAVSLPGHTPGHTGYRISSGTAQLLIWGDIVHMAALQFADPGIAISFDVDQDQAVATRRRMLDMVAADRVLVAGAHLDFPGMGHVARDGGSYRFVPAAWAYEL